MSWRPRTERPWRAFNLALLLSTGRGVPQDGERALQLLAEVAATGDGMGDYYMADLLEKDAAWRAICPLPFAIMKLLAKKG